MRVMLLFAAAMAAALMGAGAAVAQQPVAGSQAVPPPAGSAEKPARQKTLADKLAERHDFEFVETPLKDAISLLQKQSGAQFVVNVRRLEEAGVNIDTPVTKNFRQMRLSTFLELLLADLELVYVERDDELIVITTASDADSMMVNRVYDCRDLLELAIIGPVLPGALRGAAPAGAPGEGADSGKLVGGAGDGIVTEHDVRAGRLIGVIVSTINPESWSDVGGPGSIREFGGLLVIGQSARVHKEVEHVLDMLREAAGLETGGAKKVVR